MQLDKNIEDKGKFKILPLGDDNETFTGNISISNNGECKIIIWADDVDTLSLHLGDSFDLFGYLVESGNCIFIDCFISMISHGSGEITIIVNKVILDIDNNVLNGILEKLPYFNGIKFRFDNIDLWSFSRSSFEVKHNDQDNSLNIKYKPRDNILLYENDQIIVQTIFYYNSPGFPIIKNAIISEIPYIEIICKDQTKKLSLDEALEYLYYVSSFLDFMIGDISNITEIFLISKDVDGKYYKSKYIANLINTNIIPDKLKWYHVNISLDLLSKNSNVKYLKNWLDNFEKIRPSIELYRSYKMIENNSTESKFLWLAQAIEALHRRTYSGTEIPEDEYRKMKDTLKSICPPEYLTWLETKLKYGNEISFRKRLNEMLDPLWDIINQPLPNDTKEDIFTDNIKKSFKSKIVNYRNEFTHYDPRNKPLNLESALKIIVITKLLEITLFLRIYMLLGFNKDEIINLALTWRNKLGTLLRELKYQTKKYW